MPTTELLHGHVKLHERGVDGKWRKEQVLDIVGVLSLVFKRLGHKVEVWCSHDSTAAYALHTKTDSEFKWKTEEIKHITNQVFEAFYECNKNPFKTILTMVQTGFIPSF